MKRQSFALLCIALLFSHVVRADQNPTTLLEAIDQMMADLPSESAYHSWLIENGPVYGNYCGADHGDPTFEAPCLSRMDCICKTHDFGSSVKHYLQTTPGKIDESGTFRKKIEQIKAERLKFEDSALEFHDLQEIPSKQMSVSMQPLSLIAGLFALNFEKRISRVVSLQFGASFLGAGLITDTYLGFGNDRDFSAFTSLGVKTFVSGEVLNGGIYIEPFVDFGYENIVNRSRPRHENVRDIAFVPSIIVGAEKIFFTGIQVDAGIGLGFHIGIPLSSLPEDFSTNFVVPKFRASIGYAW